MSTPKQDAMDFIWERIPKQKDGNTILYLKGDITYLYTHGFVDTRLFTLKQWTDAFIPFKQKDDSFVLTKSNFLSLRPFRYNGPSDHVFDSMKIEEGPWTDKQLQELYDRSVGQASGISNETFWTYINELKKYENRLDDKGNFIIDVSVKVGLDALIRQNPSPRTVLELEVKRLKEERSKKQEHSQKNRDASGFVVGQNKHEDKESAFQNLQTTSRSSTLEANNEQSEIESIDLKSLRKPSRNFRG
ncbi:hypothetical protein BVY03_04045 [bacterium K02(2017)]|nr:hypothetical protein BVY03_04045 [bacterium K02(2017)]